MTEAYFIGIDIGTQGARVNLVDQTGNLLGAAEKSFPLTNQSREEQSPVEWWDACKTALSTLLNEQEQNIKQNVKAIAVTSTSGTVIPLDKNDQPLHHALMYSDQRSAASALRCKNAAATAGVDFTAFNSSTGLAKMVWYAETYPHKVAEIGKWVHAADFITGKISGSFTYTDYTNSFKSGYDLVDKQWPDYLFTALGLSKDWLLNVVPSGTVIGTIEGGLASELDLPTSIKVVAGITDGCASQIAAGAIDLGEWNTTIGTTMVIKGVTAKQIKDPKGRIYSHLHPSGYWMPGGASNTGADWVSNEFGAKLAELNEAAAQLIPTPYLAYPLRQKGERFPFLAADAEGFEPKNLTMAQRYTANMEGVAYVERYAYELIKALSGEQINAIYTAGGASNSLAWLTIRSNVMNLSIYKMKHVSGAFGAAILAASQTYFNSLTAAAKAMNQIELTVLPEKDLAAVYDKNYHDFKALIIQKGWANEEEVYA